MTRVLLTSFEPFGGVPLNSSHEVAREVAGAGLDRIERRLRAAEVPVERSYHAGTYICNHLLYGLLHRRAAVGEPARVGFVHLPLLPEQVARLPLPLPSCPRNRLAKGVRLALLAC